jgi:hypothetical protein
MRLRRFHIAAIAAAALTASGAAVAFAGPWGLAPGEYYTELRGSFLSAGSAYDDGGERLPAGGLIERRALGSYTELGWKKHWSVQLSLPAVSSTIRPDGGPVLSSTGFGDFGFGLRCQLANGASAKSLQLSWEAPSGYNKWISPGLGDGLQKFSATLQTGGKVGHCGLWQFGGGLRFHYKSGSELIDDITYPAARWKWADHVTTNGAVAAWVGPVQLSGLFAADLSSYTAEDPQRVTTVIVGPRVAYRVDDRLDMIAGLWHTPSGRNSLHTESYYAGIGWRTTKLDRQQGILGSETHP